MKRSALLPLALLLAACGTHSTAAPKPSPTPVTGPVAFVAAVKNLPFGDLDFASQSDNQILNVGNLACTAMKEGNTFAALVQEAAGTHGATIAQGQQLVRLSITNLCPQYDSQLP